MQYIFLEHYVYTSAFPRLSCDFVNTHVVYHPNVYTSNSFIPKTILLLFASVEDSWIQE